MFQNNGQQGIIDKAFCEPIYPRFKAFLLGIYTFALPISVHSPRHLFKDNN